MKKILEFIKDKSYYFLGGTIIIFVLLIIINSCSSNSGNSYEKIEKKMVDAAKKFYSARKNKLPKEEGSSVEVTIGTLSDAELMDEVTDPKDKSKSCTGHVEVTKVGDEYSYLPFLTCKGNYEPKYLTDIIKNVKTDEYGNGVYTINDELVYKGSDVKNYVSFNNQLWRIVKVDNDGDIKLVLAKYTEDSYPWDEAYNSEAEYNSGITTDYLHTDIRKTLNNYYKSNFDKDNKAKIVSKNLCVGKYNENDDFSVQKECSIIKENEKIGLLTATDYQNASLDTKCSKLLSQECSNYNYLSDKENISTWLLNIFSENTYEAFYLNNIVYKTTASNYSNINPVIYITSKSIISNGKGTINSPFIVK